MLPVSVWILNIDLKQARTELSGGRWPLCRKSLSLQTTHCISPTSRQQQEVILLEFTQVHDESTKKFVGFVRKGGGGSSPAGRFVGRRWSPLHKGHDTCVHDSKRPLRCQPTQLKNRQATFLTASDDKGLVQVNKFHKSQQESWNLLGSSQPSSSL